MSTQLLHSEKNPVRAERAGRKTPAGDSSTAANGKDQGADAVRPRVTLSEHIVEVLSDSGEGAQRCGQSFAAIAARMGMGIWTVEIIPAEIQPPARSIEGASGNRIRLASHQVSNGGDQADLVVAFNEQALLGRIRSDELKRGCIVLLENKWRAR